MAAAQRFSRLAAEGGPQADYYAKQAKKFAGETFAKGGTVNKNYSAMEMEHVRQMKKHNVPEKYVKQEEKEAMGMKKGGMTGCYAKGGGVEFKGKTQGKMIRMASGGSVSARADGMASKGKTKGRMC
jgi:hypothetical protein